METMEQTQPESGHSRRNNNLGIGIGLMAIGVFLLLSNWFNLGVFFVLGLGLVFAVWGMLTRTAGLLIPGGILSGIGTGIILLEGELLNVNDEQRGGVFLLAFALGWFSITLLSKLFTREPQWWALIPGSILGGIGVFVLLTNGPLQALDEDTKGAVFMLMFAAGWVVVALATSLYTRTRQGWPLIPAVIMGYIGMAIMLGGAWLQVLEFVSDWWPLGLVGFGAWLLVRRSQAQLQ
jgi:MFS family permease